MLPVPFRLKNVVLFTHPGFPEATLEARAVMQFLAEHHVDTTLCTSRTDEIDLRQVQRLDRYAEAVRLHLAYLDAITREHGHDFRAGFAEFCLQRASGGVRR